MRRFNPRAPSSKSLGKKTETDISPTRGSMYNSGLSSFFICRLGKSSKGGPKPCNEGNRGLQPEHMIVCTTVLRTSQAMSTSVCCLRLAVKLASDPEEGANTRRTTSYLRKQTGHQKSVTSLSRPLEREPFHAKTYPSIHNKNEFTLRGSGPWIPTRKTRCLGGNGEELSQMPDTHEKNDESCKKKESPF